MQRVIHCWLGDFAAFDWHQFMRTMSEESGLPHVDVNTDAVPVFVLLGRGDDGAHGHIREPANAAQRLFHLLQP